MTPLRFCERMRRKKESFAGVQGDGEKVHGREFALLSLPLMGMLVSVVSSEENICLRSVILMVVGVRAGRAVVQIVRRDNMPHGYCGVVEKQLARSPQSGSSTRLVSTRPTRVQGG